MKGEKPRKLIIEWETLDELVEKLRANKAERQADLVVLLSAGGGRGMTADQAAPALGISNPRFAQIVGQLREHGVPLTCIREPGPNGEYIYRLGERVLHEYTEFRRDGILTEIKRMLAMWERQILLVFGDTADAGILIGELRGAREKLAAVHLEAAEEEVRQREAAEALVAEAEAATAEGVADLVEN